MGGEREAEGALPTGRGATLYRGWKEPVSVASLTLHFLPQPTSPVVPPLPLLRRRPLPSVADVCSSVVITVLGGECLPNDAGHPVVL